MAVVCNSIRMGRWSELMVVCVCHSDVVMREADANDASGELGSAFPGSLVDESVFRTEKQEMLNESASWLPLVLAVPECQSEWFALKSPSTNESVPVNMWPSGGE